jgi:hypothetical protein
VAEAVVDDLEPVEVEHQHGGRAAPALGAGHRAVQPGGQQRPVGQPGQLVVEGEVLELAVGVGDLPGPLGDAQVHVLGEDLQLLGQHAEPDGDRVDPVALGRRLDPGAEIARGQLDDQLDQLVQARGGLVRSGRRHRSTTPAPRARR